MDLCFPFVCGFLHFYRVGVERVPAVFFYFPTFLMTLMLLYIYDWLDIMTVFLLLRREASCTERERERELKRKIRFDQRKLEEYGRNS